MNNNEAFQNAVMGRIAALEAAINRVSDDVETHFHDGNQTQKINLSDVFGNLETYSTTPTGAPSGIYDQVKLGSNSLYVYNTTSKQWETIGGLPAGIIAPYGGSSAPTGWVLCDGSSLARTGTYANLYAAIGTTFGSADGSHFNVPDFRTRVPAGYKSGDSNFGTLGGTLGAATHTLTTSELPTDTIVHTGSIAQAITSSGFVTQNTGGGNAHNNIQPSLTVNFIIKY